MKICFVGDATSIHMQRWVRWFSNRGHEVHLISDKPKEIKGIRIHLLTTKSGRLAFFLKSFQTRKIIKKIKPEILHAHYVFGYGTFGSFANYHPFIVSAWGSDILIEIKESYFKKKAIKYAIKRADKVHIETNMVKDIIIDLGGHEAKHVISPFGVDINKFSPDNLDGGIREKLGLEDYHVVVSTRNLQQIYDIQTLIKAIPIVLREISNIKFLIVGSGEQENYLKELAKNLKVADAVRFVGRISPDDLPKYLAISDIYVSTSLSDTISVSLLEAMSCGLPPIVSDIDGNRDVIKDGENGFFFPANNPEKLAEKVVYLMKSDVIRKNFGEKNRKIIIENYDWDKCMETIETEYKRLVEES